jgi:hypothetical protein
VQLRVKHDLHHAEHKQSRQECNAVSIVKTLPELLEIAFRVKRLLDPEDEDSMLQKD